VQEQASGCAFLPGPYQPQAVEISHPFASPVSLPSKHTRFEPPLDYLHLGSRSHYSSLPPAFCPTSINQNAAAAIPVRRASYISLPTRDTLQDNTMDPAGIQVPGTAALAAPDYAYPKEHEELEDYAINAYGWAIPIPAGVDKRNPTVLTATEPPTSPNMSWEVAWKVMKAQGVQPFRSSFFLTPEERNEDLNDPRLSRYLLVGFTLTNLGEGHFRAPATPPCPRSLSTKRPWGPWICQPTLVGDYASRAIVMVVAPLETSRPSKICLYALLNPINGVCRRYRISRYECFYLPRFRMLCGDVGGAHIRMCSFNDCVADHVTVPSPPAPVSAQPTLPDDEAARNPEAEIQPSAPPWFWSVSPRGNNHNTHG
jgi:hypothetical protein